MQSCNQGFKVKAIHDWLSQCNDKGFDCGNLKSLNNWQSHMASFVAKGTNIYLDLVDERTIVACFLFCHDIAPPPSKKTYPKVDLRDSRFPI